MPKHIVMLLECDTWSLWLGRSNHLWAETFDECFSSIFLWLELVETFRVCFKKLWVRKRRRCGGIHLYQSFIYIKALFSAAKHSNFPSNYIKNIRVGGLLCLRYVLIERMLTCENDMMWKLAHTGKTFDDWITEEAHMDGQQYKMPRPGDLGYLARWIFHCVGSVISL